MNLTRSRLFLCLCSILAACGGTSSDDIEGVSSGHDATLAQQDPLAFADELFAFDPTLDPTRTVPENVAAIVSRAQSTLGSCVTITATTDTVNISTPTGGCTTASGLSFTGSFSLAVSKSGSALTVALSWLNVELQGTSYSGTTTFVTSTGSTFSVTFALTRGGKSVSGTLTVTGSPGQITSSGSLVNGATTAVFTNVIWQQGECYPDSGTLAITVGRVTTTYSFTASTPTTGTVTSARGGTLQLPAYGSCPPSTDGGK